MLKLARAYTAHVQPEYLVHDLCTLHVHSSRTTSMFSNLGYIKFGLDQILVRWTLKNSELDVSSQLYENSKIRWHFRHKYNMHKFWKEEEIRKKNLTVAKRSNVVQRGRALASIGKFHLSIGSETHHSPSILHGIDSFSVPKVHTQLIAISSDQ
jgi:hypothetical protein